MQGIYCNMYDLPTEENGSKRKSVTHSDKPSNPCPVQQREAAIGFGLKEMIQHGPQDESRGYEAEGSELGTPSLTFELSGDIVGSSMKHQLRRVPT